MLGVDLKSVYNGDDILRAGLVGGVQLKSFSSGRGVALGDSPREVRRIMGAPTWTGTSKFVAGEKVWSYRRVIKKSENEWQFRTLVRFRRGKVAVIELNRDLLNGA